MTFSIGQFAITINIINSAYGTRDVEIKVNGKFGDNRLNAEVRLSENVNPIDLKVIVRKEDSHAP